MAVAVSVTFEKLSVQTHRQQVIFSNNL